MPPPALPSWKVHVSTWLRFFAGLRLAPFHPMPPHVLSALLNLANVGERDRFFDIGAGDGKLVVEAHRQKGVASAAGIEINAQLAAIAQLNIEHYLRALEPAKAARANLSVTAGDARYAALSDSTVISLYLSERGNATLRTMLEAHLRRANDRRVASFCFPMPQWRPISTARASGIPIYLYNQQSFQ